MISLGYNAVHYHCTFFHTSFNNCNNISLSLWLYIHIKRTVVGNPPFERCCRMSCYLCHAHWSDLAS